MTTIGLVATIEMLLSSRCRTTVPKICMETLKRGLQDVQAPAAYHPLAERSKMVIV